MCFGDMFGAEMPATPTPPPEVAPIASAQQQAAIANEAVRKKAIDDASRRGISSLRIGPVANTTGLIIPPS